MDAMLNGTSCSSSEATREKFDKGAAINQSKLSILDDGKLSGSEKLKNAGQLNAIRSKAISDINKVPDRSDNIGSYSAKDLTKNVKQSNMAKQESEPNFPLYRDLHNTPAASPEKKSRGIKNIFKKD